MGKYEDQLKTLGTSDAVFRIEGITRLESHMARLKADMTKLADDPGWTGTSADAAKELFTTLQEQFAKAEEKLTKVRSALGDANGFRADAAGAQSDLPDSSVPDWVHTAALVGGGIMIPVPGIGTFAAEFVVQRVNDFMGLQREAAAYNELKKLEDNLVGPKSEIQGAPLSTGLGGKNDPEWPKEAPTPEWPGEGVVYNGDDTGAGAWSTGGTPSSKGGGGAITDVGYVITDPRPREPEIEVRYPPHPPIVIPPERPPGWPDNFIVKPPVISVDGDVGGGTNPGGFLGGGGGIGLGLAGAGAAGLGAAKLASKGGAGGGGLFGPNGLLGGGGANGAGANGGASGGAGGKGGAVVGTGAAGAGAKGGASGMMGGGGGGGGQEKNKRSSLGIIAPKLTDDEENGPRSAAAGAGGRE